MSSAHAVQTRYLRQLWRRLAFNLLITHVDDHLQDLGFLHLGRGQWRLAPAFDLNPFPDKDRQSKTSWREHEIRHGLCGWSADRSSPRRRPLVARALRLDAAHKRQYNGY